ncbi:MAG TPA: amidohydrolase family protein [Steroidobacteraceae bacterium]|nr:amidohydrolase family protein [Steroidobacteraceae bacterium]
MRIVLAVVLATALVSEAAAETVVVSAAHLVDVLRGRVIDEPQVVITDGRIVSVGQRGAAVPGGADVRRIDLGGMTLLPGLIDMHVHLGDHPTHEGYRSLPYTDSYWVAQSVGTAKIMLEAGFTTVRNLGRDLADVGIKQAIEEGLIPGPRVIPAGYQLGPTGGHCDYGAWLPPSYHWTAPGMGDSPDELRHQVRAQRKNGAEVIKVCATGGVFTRNPGQQQLSEAELTAVVSEAHMWGLRVASHAHGTEGIKASIRAGVDTVEHASFIDDEGIRLARERGTWLSMDIYNTEYVQAHGAENGVSANSLRTDREVAVVQRAAFRKAHAAGVRMVYGTDVGGSMPHELAAKQFATMVENGMTPLEAIQSATRNAAQALGRERDVGAVEVGRFADLIAVRGDPAQDIRLLEQVAFVMKGGQVVRPATP